MKRKAALSALLALVVAAPAVIAPSVAPSMAPVAHADAEYPDVPLDHWAYNAINKLSAAGIIEGYPNGTYSGGRAMTRYEFAVAIARIIQNIQAQKGADGAQGMQGAPGVAGAPGQVGPKGDPGPAPDVSVFATKKELRDALDALTKEFQKELKALGVRVDDLENRVTALEARVVKPPRLTFSAGLLYRTGAANYINNGALGRLGNGIAVPFLSGSGAFLADPNFNNNTSSLGGNKFSYTDFELRLTDRVTDNLSLNASLRSLSGTQEDNWAGESGVLGLFDSNGFYLREANAVATLGNRVGMKNVTAVLGRQRTKIAQGLLYDNDLAPTDQFNLTGNIGPVELGAFIGSTNNSSVGGLGLNNAYLFSGANLYIGGFGLNPGGSLSGQEILSGAGNGFPGVLAAAAQLPYTDDNEAAIHGAVNLFKLDGKPVRLGATWLNNGVMDQGGYGFDLTASVFNRTVGFEWVKQNSYAFGKLTNQEGGGHAFNVTVPVIASKKLDLTLAYGKASDDFEYFLASSANPFARTYGEAIFDRGLALGAPLINGNPQAGDSQFMAAKKVFDVNGTLRVFKRLPLQFRYYKAKGTDDRDLGHVWSVGSTFNLTQGLDLEVKYGEYNPSGNFDTIKYFRVGANVGF